MSYYKAQRANSRLKHLLAETADLLTAEADQVLTAIQHVSPAGAELLRACAVRLAGQETKIREELDA